MTATDHTAPSRLVAVALRLVAIVNIAYLAWHCVEDIVEGTQTAPPLVLALGFALFSGVPWLFALLVDRLRRATIALEPAQITLTRRSARVEIPLAALAEIRPWALPLPGPGLDLRMRSGRRFRLALADPRALLEALAPSLPAAREETTRPAVAFATARAARKPRTALFWGIKFGLFPLSLTLITFRLDQVISYGGAFGQYYLQGLGPYLTSLARYAASSTSGLVIYAALVRLVAEALTLALTGAWPSRARLFRRAAEVICFVAYFVVIPGYLIALLSL